MSSELNTFKQIIRECSYDNTYKMAWAKSLVELASEVDCSEDFVTITLEQIAHKYIKYYWNQTIFFDLVQGSNLLKPPLIVTYVKQLIENYYLATGTHKPELFERAESKIDENQYNATIKKTATALKHDVSYRFLVLNGVSHQEVYQYKERDSKLLISTRLLKEFSENERDLYDLINYRWGLILETFNTSPRINKKVKIMDEREIKRHSLNKFKRFLDLENQEHICFICGKPIEKSELSIDHVIPWSYMYSDDLWNLVYVHASCNSSKSNRIPSSAEIEKLKKRNEQLLEIAESEESVRGKDIDNLYLCIQKDFVQKFWIGYKG